MTLPSYAKRILELAETWQLDWKRHCYMCGAQEDAVKCAQALTLAVPVLDFFAMFECGKTKKGCGTECGPCWARTVLAQIKTMESQ